MSMIRVVASVCMVCFLCVPGKLIAADNSEELIARGDTGSGKWSFGLQAAPLTFGLSLVYSLTPKWAVQGVVTPESGDAGVLFRVLRQTRQARFWSSYVFGGVAHGESDIFLSGSDDGTVVTAGLGVEWSWQARNPNHPPLYWSFELGLGYRDTEEGRDEFFTEDDGLFLALGWALHYNFR